ncbi:MAG: hypothetical protein F4Y50_04645 [Dehalococcoidia bacterium]|nr:hypothetical protein [Dehalococcoidia bacterium]
MFVHDAIYFSDVGNSRIRRVDLTTGVITTVAGGGLGDLGDGGPATDATFSSHPMRVTGDRAGNLFVADAHHARIRRIDTSTGTIDTVAGCGVEGYSGDGGPAVHARIASPHGTALDRHGNVYIADLKNDRIRKVDASTGIITTVAGTGEHGHSGDGGPATKAMLASPIAVFATDDGDLYIADHRNSRIRKVNAATGVITTVAGTGEQGIHGDGGPATQAAISLPRDAALDADGSLYIADGANNRIRKVAPDGTITTVAGTGRGKFSGDGGPAHEANLSMPYSIALDRAGSLYVVDTGNRRVRKIDATNGIITTIAGNGSYGFSGDGGPATDAPLAVGRRPA